MKRIGILTAGGDTPALNATIKGAVVRANQCRVEVYGFIKGFSGLLVPEVPHVHLNPLFTEIPELDATHGGTILGASRAFVDPDDTRTLDEVASRLRTLGIDGVICIGGVYVTAETMDPRIEGRSLEVRLVEEELKLRIRD